MASYAVQEAVQIKSVRIITTSYLKEDRLVYIELTPLNSLPIWGIRTPGRGPAGNLGPMYGCKQNFIITRALKNIEDPRLGRAALDEK